MFFELRSDWVFLQDKKSNKKKHIFLAFSEKWFVLLKKIYLLKNLTTPHLASMPSRLVECRHIKNHGFLL
jgi:hypothetical protein